jgi:hypothetical protein
VSRSNVPAVIRKSPIYAVFPLSTGTWDMDSPDVPSRKVIRTKRLRVPADLFEQDAVFFKRARVEAGGTIRADGHALAGASPP